MIEAVINSTLNSQIHFDSRDPSGEALPDVSLVVPMYNVEEYIAACLASLLSAANHLTLEIILIDDGSSDQTLKRVMEVLAQYSPSNTLLISQTNQGLSAVRNLGIRLFRGDYLGFLDSDDLLRPGSLHALWRFAKHNHCDLVLGRSFIFDSKTLDVSPFYDAWVWHGLLAGRTARVVTRGEESRLFMLEPNANYRLIRRDLCHAMQMSYPQGREFEDLPVHVGLLSNALRIGLLDVLYYGYRMNRRGKITEGRRQSRFDILAVSEETLRVAEERGISVSAGTALLYSLLRINWWCGTMTRPEDRRDFLEKLVRLFEQIPIVWRRGFKGLEQPEEILHLVLGAIERRDINRLLELSLGHRVPLRSALDLVRLGRWDLLKKRIVKSWDRGLKAPGLVK